MRRFPAFAAVAVLALAVTASPSLASANALPSAGLVGAADASDGGFTIPADAPIDDSPETNEADDPILPGDTPTKPGGPETGYSADAANPADVAAAGAGAFITNGDRVHVSSTPPATASGHGWWLKISGSGTKAKVTVVLQAKDRNGTWHNVATGSKIVKPGGGSSRRANARKTCTNINRYTTWRSVIDVDIIGVADSADKAYTPEMNFFCDAF